MKSKKKFLIFILFLITIVMLTSTIFAAERQERNNPAISLVIDRSGSMGFSNYMTPAKQRAQTFVGLMETGDQVGVVSYAEEASTNHQLVTITSDAIKTAVQNSINQIQSEGRTSIGAGLNLGRNQLNAATVSGQKAMILLSDGLDNYTPFAINVVPTIPISIDVYTIALGPNSDQNLLQWIANQTGGTYHYMPTPAVLQQIYDAIAGDIRGYESYLAQHGSIESFDTITVSVNVDTAADYVNFNLTTNEDFSDNLTVLDMVLIDPVGNQIEMMDIIDDGLGNVMSGFSYLSYRINAPQEGTWQIVITNDTANGDLDYDFSVYGKSSLKMQRISPADEFVIDDPLDLIVEIDHQDVSISGATVTAFITPPSYDPDGTVEEIMLTMQETEPGRYEAAFTETDIQGSYRVRYEASMLHESLTVNRKILASYYFAPPGYLQAPHQIYPENIAQDLPLEIEFLWTPVLDADTYHIQIADSQDILFDIDDIEMNTISITLPEYNSEYMWRIRANSAQHEGIWSDIYSFTTGIPDIPAPNNLEADVEGNSIILAWEQPEEDDYFGDPSYYKIYRDMGHYESVSSGYLTFIDLQVYPNQTYTYYITAVYNGNEESLPSNMITITFTGVDQPDEFLPVSAIKYNYPNPFNPETTIVFSLAEAGDAELAIYDVRGKLVTKLIDGYLETGEHTTTWRGLSMNDNPVPSGVYFVRLTTGNFTGHTKILLLK